MQKARKLNFLSLYFSSIGFKESLQTFLSLFTLPFLSENKLRLKLHKLFSANLNNNAVFSYSSARASLTACLNAVDISKDDEVLLSSFSCLAVPTAILAAGAIPKYYDINTQTMNADLESIKGLITSNTKVIVLQHSLGTPAPIDPVKEIIAEKNIIIIEDCALSIGTTDGHQLVGTNADASIFSLELSKTISCGWGGILLVNEKQLEERVKTQYKEVGDLGLIKEIKMALQVSISGFLYSPSIFFIGKYLIAIFFKLGIFSASTPPGEERGQLRKDFLSKLPKSLLPLANIQVLRLNEIITRHSKNSIRLRKSLVDLNYHLLGKYPEGGISVSPRVPFLVKDRKSFIAFFANKGIEVGTWFDGPLTPLPQDSIFNFKKSDHPNASFVARHIVNLPCHAKTKDFHLRQIEQSLKEYALEYPDHFQIEK